MPRDWAFSAFSSFVVIIRPILKRIVHRASLTFRVKIMALNLSAQMYLGSHRLLNPIGSGKLCAVWDAIVDSKSERRALKILLKLDKNQIALMKREYQLAKDLNHPNVIRFYEYGLHQEHPFVAMEYFPSINLKQLLQQKGVEGIAPKLPSILQQCALGLGYFHDQV